MNMYEIKFHYRGQSESMTRRVMGWDQAEAEEWLRDTLWRMEYGAKTIVIEKTVQV